MMNQFCRLFLILTLCSISLNAFNIREGKITGGHEAHPHSHPYIVCLQTRFLWLSYRHCSGSILSEQWIVSAGHCVTDYWASWFSMDAIVGAHNLAKITNSMIYSVSHRIAHPMYRGGVGPYDIAMIRTSRKMHFSAKVQPIRLPMSFPTYKETDRFFISGWGALQSTLFTTVLPNKLQEVEVTPLSFNECYRAVDVIKDSYELNPLKRIHNMCSGPISGGISGCLGDSGGPLVQNVPVTTPQTTIAVETTRNEEETASTMAFTKDGTDSIPTTIESTSTDGSSISPLPVNTDRPSTTPSESTSTDGSSISPLPVNTDRPSTTPSESTSTDGSSISPLPVNTDRPSTTPSESTSTDGSSISPLPVNTDRPTTTTTESTSTDGSSISPLPVNTDRPSTTPSESTSTDGSSISPLPVNTDRPSTTPSESTSTDGSSISPLPVNTDRPTTTTTESTSTDGSTISPIPMTTDRSLTINAGSNSESRIRLNHNHSFNEVDDREINNVQLLKTDMIPMIIGIISWGVVPCGDKGAPTAYSNITNYLDFITKHLHSN